MHNVWTLHMLKILPDIRKGNYFLEQNFFLYAHIHLSIYIYQPLHLGRIWHKVNF